MIGQPYLEMIQNAALLLALALVHEVVLRRFRSDGPSLRQVPVGVAIGLIGIVVMATPWTLEPGIIFDTRSVLLAVSGLYLGGVPTAIAMAMTAAARLAMGGAAAWAGVAVIVTSGVGGLVFRHRRRKDLARISLGELYVFGVFVHLAMLACLLTLPTPIAARVVPRVALPVLAIYPVGTALLGGLMAARARREETEEALRSSEERFRRAVVESPVPAMLYTEDGDVLMVSRSWCETSGYGPEELRTIDAWFERAYGENAGRAREVLRKTFASDRRVEEGDFEVRTRGGETRVWTFSAAPLGPLPDGRRAYISLATDVTERRRAEAEVHRLNESLERHVAERTAQLEQAVKELDAFSYSISHDLRAPVRAIHGYARILEEEHGSQLDAEGRRLLGIVQAGARRMGLLIDDLLRFSRLLRQPLRMDEVDMTSLVGDVFSEIRSRSSGRDVELRLSPLPPATADPALIRQVWANLIDNAIKYTGREERAVIEVSGEVGEDRVAYHVRDNGVGFDMAHSGALFGVFQRLHGSDEFEGTGVGLALVQRIVQRHHGQVWANAAPGEGATFSFSLPRARARAA